MGTPKKLLLLGQLDVHPGSSFLTGEASSNASLPLVLIEQLVYFVFIF